GVPLHGVDPEVDLSVARTDPRAVWQVALWARAQHDGTPDAQLVEGAAHRLAGRVADRVRVAPAEEARAHQRRRLRGVHELERELAARLKRRDSASLVLHVGP